MTRLVLSADDRAAISARAAAAWPEEACGLLVGRRAGDVLAVSRAVAADNVADDRRRRFEVDPRVLLAAHRDARAAGEEVLGPWHSHPDGRAEPSATDAERARLPGEAWLVVPVTGAGAGVPRAWLYDGAAFAEIAIAQGIA